MTVLSSDNYPSIRAALDITMTADMLPDATIALDLYKGRADREIVTRIPTAETLVTPDGDEEVSSDGQRVLLAAILLCASYIAPAIPAITAQTFGAAIYERSVDWNQRSADLKMQAETEIQTVILNQAVATTATTSRYTMFTVASV